MIWSQLLLLYNGNGYFNGYGISRMDTDMAYYGWKRSQLALHNGNGYGILWMETEPIGII